MRHICTFKDSSQLTISLTLVSNQFLDLILTNGARFPDISGTNSCGANTVRLGRFSPLFFRSDFFNPLAKKKITKKRQNFKLPLDSLVISHIWYLVEHMKNQTKSENETSGFRTIWDSFLFKVSGQRSFLFDYIYHRLHEIWLFTQLNALSISQLTSIFLLFTFYAENW